MGNFHDGLFAHTIDDEVGPRVAEDAGAQTVLPVVVMGDAPQRGLNAAKDDRHVRIQLFQDLRVDDGGVLWPQVVAPVRRVGIFRTQTLGSGVLVDHRVHTAR